MTEGSRNTLTHTECSRRSAATGRGSVASTDGPYAEAKEHLGGYYMVEYDNLERATEIAVKIPDARWERVEIRPAMDVAGLEM
jgi:hypothetical protein